MSDIVTVPGLVPKFLVCTTTPISVPSTISFPFGALPLESAISMLVTVTSKERTVKSVFMASICERPVPLAVFPAMSTTSIHQINSSPCSNETLTPSVKSILPMYDHAPAFVAINGISALDWPFSKMRPLRMNAQFTCKSPSGNPPSSIISNANWRTSKSESSRERGTDEYSTTGETSSTVIRELIVVLS